MEENWSQNIEGRALRMFTRTINCTHCCTHANIIFPYVLNDGIEGMFIFHFYTNAF